MAQPRAWPRYIKACEQEGGLSGPLARFAARFDVATRVQGVELDGVAEDTQDAYAGGLRVGLAYSALESLDRALDRRPGRHRLVDAGLAHRYRETGNKKLRAVLESASEGRLVNQLRALAGDEAADDLMPVAAAVRHAMFHGDFTAHGTGAARSAAVRSFLTDLADLLIATADDEFELYLDRAVIGPWQIDVQQQCPSCGVSNGDKHDYSCSIGRCKAHGGQRAWCMSNGRHGRTTYWGVYPGTVEALKRGWYISMEGDKVPDLNRVVVELTWDSETETYR